MTSTRECVISMSRLIRIPSGPGRRMPAGRLCAAILLPALLLTMACSEGGKRKVAKGKAKAAAPAKAAVAPCPLAPGALTPKGVGGIELGQLLAQAARSCGPVRVQSGMVSPSLKFATRAIWLITGKDSLRVLADRTGKIVEVDALTPGFVSPDSIRVGATLAEVMRRRPAAAQDGGLEILQDQLVVTDGPCGGVLPVLADNRSGQLIGLTRDEIARVPSTLKVKRLAVISCRT